MTPVRGGERGGEQIYDEGKRRADESAVLLQLPLGMEGYLKRDDMMEMCARFRNKGRRRMKRVQKFSKKVGLGRVIFQRCRL